MSAVASMVPAMSVNPWRWLRDLALVTLHWHDGEPMGVSDIEAGTISLQCGMNRAERRCTIAHEVIHHERGIEVLEALEDREELRVEKEAALRLLPDICFVGDAMAWAECDLEAAAHELDVDPRTLWVRLHYLQGTERGYLTRRLADH